MTALQTLHDKVEAGTAAHQDFGIFVTPFDDDSVILRNNAWFANEGSLDAAKALHDAVLPEGRVHELGQNSCCDGWYAVLWSPSSDYVVAGSTRDPGLSPARAWLLAILRALINEDQQP